MDWLQYQKDQPKAAEKPSVKFLVKGRLFILVFNNLPMCCLQTSCFLSTLSVILDNTGPEEQGNQ